MNIKIKTFVSVLALLSLFSCGDEEKNMWINQSTVMEYRRLDNSFYYEITTFVWMKEYRGLDRCLVHSSCAVTYVGSNLDSVLVAEMREAKRIMGELEAKLILQEPLPDRQHLLRMIGGAEYKVDIVPTSVVRLVEPDTAKSKPSFVFEGK